MENVIHIFKEIQMTSGKNDKQRIIKANVENELFKSCLVFLLDGSIVTGISKAKINKKLSYDICNQAFEQLSEVMDYLKANNTGRDVDIANVQMYIDKHDQEEQEFIKQLITKSLTLGVDYKTVNKAIPHLIRSWEVQLGSPIEKCKIKDGEWFSLSQKLNGNRCSFYKGKLISRQGKEFKGFQHIIDDILSCGLSEYFVDGELVRKNVDGVSDGENFRVGTGIINSDADTKEEIELVIFDLFPVYEFDEKQHSCHTYKERIVTLNTLMDDIKQNDIKNIKVVRRLYEGTDQTQIDKWLDYAVENDWEGLMLNKDDYYMCKRVTTLAKIKRFYTCDLKIVDVLEGEGRLKGTLGALVVHFKENTVRVGSGFTDEQRSEIWENKDNLIGRVAEVKYKEISKDKTTGLESLQFPIFVCIREVGKEVSYN